VQADEFSVPKILENHRKSLKDEGELIIRWSIFQVWLLKWKAKQAKNEPTFSG